VKGSMSESLRDLADTFDPGIPDLDRISARGQARKRRRVAVARGFGVLVAL